MLTHWSQLVPDTSTDIRGHEALLPHHRNINMAFIAADLNAGVTV